MFGAALLDLACQAALVLPWVLRPIVFPLGCYLRGVCVCVCSYIVQHGLLLFQRPYLEGSGDLVSRAT